MPSFRWHKLKWFTDEASKYESILDIGCGLGTWIRHMTAPLTVGIDGHRPTLEVARQKSPNTLLICEDIKRIAEFFLPNTFECITAMDSIEHLFREEALVLLKDFENIASKRIMLFIPLGDYPQSKDLTGLNNEALQTHRSTWVPKDTEELGYETEILTNFHGQDRHAFFAFKTLE